MPQNVRSLPQKDSTDWYAHYTDHDLAIRELQTLLGATSSSQAIAGFLAMNQAPDAAAASISTVASTTYVLKQFTPQAITAATVGLLTSGTAAATPSAFYVALYDASGALIPGSGSADIASQLTASSAYVAAALGSPVSVPAGVFYVALRSGTAGTQPAFRAIAAPPSQIVNAGLTSSVGPSSFRIATAANAWSGATPPATLGALSASNLNIFAGVK